MKPQAEAPRGAALRIPPPLVFLGAIVGGRVSSMVAPPLDLVVPVAVAVPLGVVLAAAGLALGLDACRSFRRTGQDPAPWRPAPALVASGAFRLVRNPMYLGMTLLVLGIGAAARDPWTGALALPALWVVHRTAVLPEERYLRARFGDAYAAYERRVSRYLPCLPASSDGAQI